MEDEVKKEEVVAQEPAIEAPSDVAKPQAASANKVYLFRVKRINELRMRSLLHPDPFVAALQASNADLLDSQAYVAEALRRARDSAPIGLDQVEEHAPATDIMIRHAKAISQNAQIGLQIAKREASRPVNHGSEKPLQVLPTPVPDGYGGWTTWG